MKNRKFKTTHLVLTLIGLGIATLTLIPTLGALAIGIGDGGGGGGGLTGITGYVKYTTGQPFEEVKVSLYANGYRNDIDYTDSNGKFTVYVTYLDLGQSSVSVRLKFEKSGYSTKNVYTTAYSGTIRTISTVKYTKLSKNTWALIFSGYKGDFDTQAVDMYNTLIDHYGFTADRTYLLVTEDRYANIRDGRTTLASVEWAVNKIRDRASALDQVVIFCFSHGYGFDGTRFCCGYKAEIIYGTTFDTWIDRINCAEMYIFLSPCRSGPFGRDLGLYGGKPNRAVYTSSNGEDAAPGVWPNAIIGGLDPDLQATTADTNGDGKVSLWELYNYARTKALEARPWQDPQRHVSVDLCTDSNDFIGDAYY